MALLQCEAKAAIVQHHACSRRADTGAEIGEQRVDERDHVALAVGRGKVDGVAAVAAIERGPWRVRA
jgi:hypothetical protein